VKKLIEAHAILHQKNRVRDEKGRIIAAPEDYAAVRGLVEQFVGISSEKGVTDKVREWV
jgi:hypothetical protein